MQSDNEKSVDTVESSSTNSPAQKKTTIDGNGWRVLPFTSVVVEKPNLMQASLKQPEQLTEQEIVWREQSLEYQRARKQKEIKPHPHEKDYSPLIANEQKVREKMGITVAYTSSKTPINLPIQKKRSSFRRDKFFERQAKKEKAAKTDWLNFFPADPLSSKTNIFSEEKASSFLPKMTNKNGE